MRTLLLALLLASLTFAQSYLMIVHNPNSQTLTNFQVRAKLPADLQGKALTIKDMNGNPVPFCYETATGECTTDPTQGDGYVWVKVPSIPANGDAKLVVEVGSNGAVKGDRVFEFYDDFNNPSSLNQWEVIEGKAKIENGALVLTDAGPYQELHLQGFSFYNGVIEVRWKWEKGCDCNYGGMYVLARVQSDGSAYAAATGSYANEFVIAYDDDGNRDSWTNLETYGSHNDLVEDNWYYVYFALDGENLKACLYESYISGKITCLSATDDHITTSGKIGLGGWQIEYFDWIRVRKYAPIEPTVTFQAYGGYQAPSTVTGMSQVWSYDIGSSVEALAFSDNGNLGAASVDRCAYVFDQSGNLLNKVCGDDWMNDISYANGKFLADNYDNYLYIMSERGTLIKKLEVGESYDDGVTAFSQGFIVCDDYCAYYNWNYEKIWDTSVGSNTHTSGPAIAKGYVYALAVDSGKVKIISLSSGSVEGSVTLDGDAYDVAACGNYLAAASQDKLYLYSLDDPTSPTLLWTKDISLGDADYRSLAFSPNCKFLALADTNNDQVDIFNAKTGAIVYTKDFDRPTAVAWWKDELAVAQKDGSIYVFRLEGFKGPAYSPTPSSSTITGLTLLWRHGFSGTADAVAIADNGNVGVANYDNCAYVLSKTGSVLGKYCGGDDVDDASYCCGKFGFADIDDYDYFLDVTGNYLKAIHVGDDYDFAITMLPNGFIACDDYCGYFTYSGSQIWSTELDGEARNGPAVYKSYVYVPDYGEDEVEILSLSDGSVLNKMSFSSAVHDVGVCGKYLAVVTSNKLYLYKLTDPTDPTYLWSVGNIYINDEYSQNLAFSPDCRYVAVADTGNRALKIYDIQGNLVLKRSFPDPVRGVDWRKDWIAVSSGYYVYLFKVEGYKPQGAPVTKAQMTTVTNTVTVTKTITTTVTQTVTKEVTSTVTLMIGGENVKVQVSGDLLQPYIKLTKLYDTISKSTGYKATLLKAPFQRQIAYISALSNFASLAKRLYLLLGEAKDNINKAEQLLQKQPTFKNAFEFMNLVQKAIVNLNLANDVLKRLEAQVNTLKASMPSIDCTTLKTELGDPIELTYKVLNATTMLELIQIRKELEKYGGIDALAKCVIKETIQETIALWNQKKVELMNEIAKLKAQAEELNQYVKYLSVGG
ncbi:hypothetical protein IPA_03250 [Ignicoccus pacificus DSM 13166]|uniref:DUF2341 domain-containing protein n=1 Tax=Ignicoccus pacificus DSM 13166 TaxID=940294 RepID=A0A977K992_9CREN|nr:hypothetical protein IPA_03250 [Ignicoccus pacificus DSM 13166]